MQVRLLQSLDHVNVIKYLDSFITDDDLVIVVEWAAAGDLKRQLRKAQERGANFEERTIWKYFSQICEAMRHMHERRIMHRDLKPANIFLTLDGVVKVGDLGLSRELSEHTIQAHSKVGTPLYMSPEVLRGDGYDLKSDIWSIGCLLYELAMLKSPFKSEGLNLYSLFQKISQGDFQPLPEMYSESLRSLTYSMISTRSEDRPDMAHICEVAARMKTLSAEKYAKEKQEERDRQRRGVAMGHSAAGEITEGFGGEQKLGGGAEDLRVEGSGNSGNREGQVGVQQSDRGSGESNSRAKEDKQEGMGKGKRSPALVEDLVVADSKLSDDRLNKNSNLYSKNSGSSVTSEARNGSDWKTGTAVANRDTIADDINDTDRDAIKLAVDLNAGSSGRGVYVSDSQRTMGGAGVVAEAPRWASAQDREGAVRSGSGGGSGVIGSFNGLRDGVKDSSGGSSSSSSSSGKGKVAPTAAPYVRMKKPGIGGRLGGDVNRVGDQDGDEDRDRGDDPRDLNSEQRQRQRQREPLIEGGHGTGVRMNFRTNGTENDGYFTGCSAYMCNNISSSRLSNDILTQRKLHPSLSINIEHSAQFLHSNQ